MKGKNVGQNRGWKSVNEKRSHSKGTVPIFVRHAWKLGKGVATQFVQREDVFFQLSHFVSEYVGR